MLLITLVAQSDLTGIWNSATATPLERPAALSDKPFFTAAEAKDWERRAEKQNEEPAPHSSGSNSVGTYNVAFREFNGRVQPSLRTSIITDPADGRIPALTPPAAEDKKRRMDRLRHPNGPRDLGLQDQCLSMSTTGPPMIPYSYNSNYQIVATKDAVMIQVEMIHETRIIHLDRKTHAPAAIRSWTGDSIGHWEGSTLVVDTTNFNDGGGFYGDAGGMFGWDRNLHVIERFSLRDPNTLQYQFEVDDPSAFTQPWKGELFMTRSEAPLYEYACHEGNYALPSLLRGLK